MNLRHVAHAYTGKLRGENLAAARRFKAVQAAQQRRLAASGRTYDRDKLALAPLEARITESFKRRAATFVGENVAYFFNAYHLKTVPFRVNCRIELRALYQC